MKLSIALTTYNGARYLEPQLASFVAQTRRPDELVVCDERSTDATGKILADFQAAAPFPVRVITNEQRLGIIANFEKAVGLCTGEIVFLSDQDDSWHPDKLARHEAIYASQPDVGLVFSDAEIVGSDLQPLGVRMNQRLGVTPDRLAQLSGDRALHLLIRRPFLLGCTLSFRADLRRYLAPFPDNQLHDNWIPFALASVTKFQGIADPLIDYRSHEGQSVGVFGMRPVPVTEGSAPAPPPAPEPARPAPTPNEGRAVEFRRQISLLDTLTQQVAGFRDQVRVPDLDRLLAAKRRFLDRRLRLIDRPLPARLLTILPDLISGGYFRYAGYPRGEFLRDLKGV